MKSLQLPDLVVRDHPLVRCILSTQPRDSTGIHSKGERKYHLTHLLKLMDPFVLVRTVIPEVPVEPVALGAGLALEVESV
jgi:hypothetical protein